MRHLKYILILAFSFICYACVENDPDIETFPSDDVNFKYEVIGDYKIDYLVGSQIQFTNTSVVKGACTWDFGDGTPVSNEENPIHKYEVAGTKFLSAIYFRQYRWVR